MKKPIDTPLPEFPDMKFSFDPGEMPDADTIKRGINTDAGIQYVRNYEWKISSFSGDPASALLAVMKGLPALAAEAGLIVKMSNHIETTSFTARNQKITPEDITAETMPGSFLARLIEGEQRPTVLMKKSEMRMLFETPRKGDPIRIDSSPWNYTQNQIPMVMAVIRLLGRSTGNTVRVEKQQFDADDTTIFAYDPATDIFYTALGGGGD